MSHERLLVATSNKEERTFGIILDFSGFYLTGCGGVKKTQNQKSTVLHGV